MKAVNSVVSEYYKIMEGVEVPLSCKEVSELFRYSMCRILNLDTCSSTKKLAELSKMVINGLTPTVEKTGIMSKMDSFRQGFLEACVHCVEMSRKKVEG